MHLELIVLWRDAGEAWRTLQRVRRQTKESDEVAIDAAIGAAAAIRAQARELLREALLRP